VRELAAAYYAQVVGRPSIDPIVLVKLMLAGALEGVGSGAGVVAGLFDAAGFAAFRWLWVQ
jgi:hypothetical protein